MASSVTAYDSLFTIHYFTTYFHQLNNVAAFRVISGGIA